MDVFIYEGNIRMRFSLKFCTQQPSEITVYGEFSDSQWHYVVITLGFQHVSISVDKTSASETVKCKDPEYIGEFTVLRKRRWTAMYLGGIAVMKRLGMSLWSSPKIFVDAPSAR
jgi:hypothetical protein